MSESLYCPKCGNVDFASHDDRRYACPRCGYTYYSNTAAGTSAVIWCRGKLALITRACAPGKGLLDLPGGFVDSDESLEQAVLREVREETGMQLARPRFLFSVPNRYRYHAISYSTVDVFFEFEIDTPTPFEPNAEASALSWLAPKAIAPEQVAFHSVRVALERLARADARE